MATRRNADDLTADSGMPADGADSHAAATDSAGGADEQDSMPVPPQPVILAPAPYYVATAPLYHGSGEGTMPVRAFNPGDRVPADLMAPNGWVPTDLVRHPDDPDPAPAATTDATTAGQE
jgi:hypothetical protein